MVAVVVLLGKELKLPFFLFFSHRKRWINTQMYGSDTRQNMWNKSLETVARFVRADPQDLVFVANATAGINSVLKFLDLYS